MMQTFLPFINILRVIHLKQQLGDVREFLAGAVKDRFRDFYQFSIVYGHHIGIRKREPIQWKYIPKNVIGPHNHRLNFHQ